MRFHFCIILLLFLCAGLHAPVLAEKPQSKAALERQAKSIKKELSGMQGKLVGLAKSMQKNEHSLNELDSSIAKMEAEQSDIQEALQKDRGSMADLILALQRVRRLPPEALLVKPDAPLKTAQSAMLLESILPDLYKKAEMLKVNLAKNEALTHELTAKREKLAHSMTALQKDHSKLSGLTEKRKSLYRSAQKDLAAREKKTKTIAAQAKDLKDLVKNLNKERKRRHARQSAQNTVARAPVLSTPKTLPKAGQARLPISGVIKTRFHQPDHFGAPSRGLDIEGRGGALVVAPMGGIVRFSGPFKNYGNMVIIEHADGYHSLVAGLERLHVAVGQSVLSAEPLGLLHYASRGEKPVLYYELRYNGKAVNPSRKISGLN